MIWGALALAVALTGLLGLFLRFVAAVERREGGR